MIGVCGLIILLQHVGRGVCEDGREVDTPMSKDFVASSRPESKDGESVGAGTPPALGHRYGKA
jgi:hypothetical protein